LIKSKEAQAGSDPPKEDAGAPEPPGNRAETAAYIADLSAHLATLARRENFSTLAYLLDMVRLEAEGLRNGPSQ
jgi:hypothetical protein